MTNNLLLMAWPSQGQVLTSFRWTPTYTAPVLYTGDAALTQISSRINATHYSVIFRCRNCLKWDQDGNSGAAMTSQGYLVIGWALANSSPSNPTCPSTARVGRHENQGIFGATFRKDAGSSQYISWAAKAVSTVAGTCGAAPPSSTKPTPTTSTKAPVSTTTLTKTAVSTTTLTKTTVLTMTTSTKAPAPTPTSSLPSCAQTYTVVSGEYCYLIATNHGLSLAQFYDINPGLSCDNLQIGRVVCVRGR